MRRLYSRRPYRLPRIVLGLFLGLALPAATPIRAETGPAWVVIVHPTNAIVRITAEELARIYLGKQDKLPNGLSAQPLDQSEGSALYKQFSETVLGRSPGTIKAHWARRIFAGEGTPPRRLGSDAEVMGYVASHPEAVGYVTSAALLQGVKAVEVTALPTSVQ